MPSEFSFPTLLGISSFQLGLNAVRLFFNAILLPLQLEEVLPAAQKSQMLGIIVGVSVGIGILVNFFAGTMSDRNTSRRGKRTPFILMGALFTIPFVLLSLFFPLSVLVIFTSYLGVQFFTNLSLGAYRPILPEIVPEGDWDREASMQVMMALIGSALAFLGAQWISDLEYSPVILISLALLVTISTLFTLWGIKPFDRSTTMAVSKPLKQEAGEILQSNTQPNGYFWLVLAIFLIYMGLFSLQYFGIYYFEGVIHHSNPAKAMSITGLINLVITMIATMMAHRISNIFGRRNLIIIVITLAALINLAFPFAHSLLGYILIAIPYTALIGLFSPVNLALTSELVPKKATGKFLWFSYMAFGCSNVLSPLIGGFILSATDQAPGVNSFIALYVFSSIFFLAGSLIMLKVPKSIRRVAQVSRVIT
jgi:MFS family permease